MSEQLLSLGDTVFTDLNKRMVSVSNLLLMREQQSQYNSTSTEDHEKDSTTITGIRMDDNMQMQNENKGQCHNRGDGKDEDEGRQNITRVETNDDCDDDRGSYASDGNDEDDDDGGVGPLRIVLGTTSNQNINESDEDENDDEHDENNSSYDYREQQQLLQYQQRKLQMHQDLTAYNTGSLTVSRFPMNGHQTQQQTPTAERCSNGVKFSISVLPNEANATISPGNLGSCRTGLSSGDREIISSPQLNQSNSINSPFYLNNNNKSNIPNNNNNSIMTKGTSGITSNGHSQMLQEQAEKFQRYHAPHLHPHGQKRHSSSYSQKQQQQGQGHGQGHDRKPQQQGSFPYLSDVKPDSLAAHSQLNTLSRSIGNALLNLASFGSLATIQQQQSSTGTSAPATVSSAFNAGSQYSGGSNNSMTPLNLTSACAGSPSPNPMTHITNNNLANSYLAHYISQQQQQTANINGVGNFLTAQSVLQPGSFPNGTTGSLPQLILASGNIVQGIQGAQLLIPTSQGLMTQTILTIPITQPASPSGLLSPPIPGKTRPPSEGPLATPPCPNSPPEGSTPLSNHRGPHLVNQSQQHCIGGAASVSHTHNISNNSIPEKVGNHERMNLTTNMNMGLNRMTNGRRESSGTNISAIQSSHGANLPSPMNATLCQPSKMSPCSSHSHDQDSDFDFDKGSDNDDSNQMVDGINLDEIKEFAKAFKLRRLSLGLTQTQVGQALSVTEGPAYSQSAICSALAWQMAQSNSNRTSIPQSSMFEKLDITPKSAQKIKPVLERWMKEAEDRFKNGHQTLHEFVGMEPSKKRKRRTSFTPQALEILNTHFERNTHPSGAEITTLAHQLGYEREVIRIWFCNKRQALKNTVRMMSKGSSPV